MSQASNAFAVFLGRLAEGEALAALSADLRTATDLPLFYGAHE